MTTRKARRLSLPRSRTLVSDLLYFSKKIPTCVHERTFQLGEIDALRKSTQPRISWPLVFIRSFALATVDQPVFRQCHMQWPWPHLYEHPHHVAMLAVVREYLNDHWLFFGAFQNPEESSLIELQRQLNFFKSGEVKEAFALQLRATKLPLPLRRFLWWARINFFGKRRAKRLGTFGMTTISSRGATIVDPPGLLTSTLTYGPIDENGNCRVAISYDHRLMDGWFVAEALDRMETEMKSTIREELSHLVDDRQSNVA